MNTSEAVARGKKRTGNVGAHPIGELVPMLIPLSEIISLKQSQRGYPGTVPGSQAAFPSPDKLV